jgi:hypothetical protein
MSLTVAFTLTWIWGAAFRLMEISGVTSFSMWLVYMQAFYLGERACYFILMLSIHWAIRRNQRVHQLSYMVSTYCFVGRLLTRA